MNFAGWLALAAAGAAGTVLRFALGGAVARLAGGSAPWGTLFVNLVGCAAAGAVAGLIDRGGLVPPALRIPIVAGLLGGFTTFSAYAIDGVRLFSGGHGGLALAYLLGTNALGLAGAWWAWRLVAGR